MKRRTFLGVASATLAAVTNVCFANGSEKKPDVLVFTLKPADKRRFTLHTLKNFHAVFSEVAKATGCKVVVIDGHECECAVVGKRTFYSAKSGGRYRVCSRVTGEEIRELITWCETETGLVAYFPIPAPDQSMEGGTMLMQVEGGLIVEKISQDQTSGYLSANELRRLVRR